MIHHLTEASRPLNSDGFGILAPSLGVNGKMWPALGDSVCTAEWDGLVEERTGKRAARVQAPCHLNTFNVDVWSCSRLALPRYHHQLAWPAGRSAGAIATSRTSLYHGNTWVGRRRIKRGTSGTLFLLLRISSWLSCQDCNDIGRSYYRWTRDWWIGPLPYQCSWHFIGEKATCGGTW